MCADSVDHSSIHRGSNSALSAVVESLFVALLLWSLMHLIIQLKKKYSASFKRTDCLQYVVNSHRNPGPTVQRTVCGPPRPDTETNGTHGHKRETVQGKKKGSLISQKAKKGKFPSTKES